MAGELQGVKTYQIKFLVVAPRSLALSEFPTTTILTSSSFFNSAYY